MTNFGRNEEIKMPDANQDTKQTVTVEQFEALQKQMQALDDRAKALESENVTLKGHVKKVLDEKADVEAKRKEAEDKALQTKAKTDDDWKNIVALKDKELQALKDEQAKKDELWQERNLKDEARKLAQTLASDPRKVDDLTDKISKRIKMTEDGIKVTDEHGNLTIDKTDKLLGDFKARYDYLCDGIQSTGAGAVGNTTNMQQKMSYKDMTEAQRVDLKRTDIVEFQRLRAEAGFGSTNKL